jgi:hypothetical protein
MRSYGSHLHRSARPYDIQHEGSCAIPRCGDQSAAVSLLGWGYSRTWWQGVAHQRADRSRSRFNFAACQKCFVRNCRQTESKFQRLGSSRVSETPIFRMANRICGIHGKSFAEANRAGLHYKSGGASSEAIVQGRVDCVPQETRNRIRREISLGMNAPLSKYFLSPRPGLGSFDAYPRLAPWATICRHSVAIA